MNDYINVEKMQVAVFELLKDTREKMRDDENTARIDDCVSDDFINEEAFEIASSINSDMKAYLHQKDHEIQGNFNNIENNYYKFRKGEYGWNEALLNDMIARLDNNRQDEQTQKDREFLSDWYFETFGTFGITYNFGNTIDYLIEDDDNENND